MLYKRLSLFFAAVFAAAFMLAPAVMSAGSQSYNTSASITEGGGDASSAGYSTVAYTTGSAGNATSQNYETTVGQFFSAPNAVPSASGIILNTTTNSNRTAENLDCFGSASDPDDTALEAYLQWWNGTSLELFYYVAGIQNGTLTKLSTLGSLNTTKAETWTCSVLFGDGKGNESAWSNATLTILNTPPAQTVLSAPPSGSSTTNRTPSFSWEEAGDDDSDTLRYALNITCGYAGGGTDCSDDNSETIVDAGNCTGDGFCNFTIPYELSYFGDDNYYYNWTVRAYDGEEYGAWSATWNLTMNTDVRISLYNSTVEFGTIYPEQTYDTTGDDPNPFRIRNDGNCLVDVNISATDLLWDTVPAPSDYFRYVIDNVTGEEGSLDWSSQNTTTTWTPIPLVNGSAISSLNYSDNSDSAEIEVQITVPTGELGGVKTAIMWFTAGYHG